MAHSRIQQITSFLAYQQEQSHTLSTVPNESENDHHEETTAFEVLGEEDFQTLEEQQEKICGDGRDELWKQKKEIIRKMDAYLSEIEDMTGSYRQQ